MIKIRILSKKIVTEQTDINEGKEYLEVILNYLQTDIAKAVQAMNSGNTKELEKDKFDYKLFKSIEKDFDFILEKESKIRSWIKKENVGWDFQDYFHADLLEPEDQKNEEDLIEILAREKDVKVCDGTLRKRNKKNEVNFKLQTKKALRDVYRGQDKDYEEGKKGSIKFNFGLLVNYDILNNSKIIAFKSLKKKSVFSVELTKDTISYDPTPYREGYIYGEPYFLISPQKEMVYMISFRDLGLFAECYRLIKGWAPQIDKLYKKSFSQKHMPTFRKFFGFYDSSQNIDEGIVTEQEKITLSQIVGENSVISFDFDNTLVKSYPDIDDDGELTYINGGSNTTMINLMKHLIDDPSKKVYLVTSRSEEFDQKTPEQSVKVQLDKLGVNPDGIFFTNSQPKVTKLKELGVEIHFDDDRMEHGDIQGSGIKSFYPDDFLEDTNQVSKVVAVTLDNKVLVLKRADTGEFDIPGGHGKSGETPEFTAIRETLEETGLDLFGLKQIMSKQVTFKGRSEQITYFYAKLNNTSEMLMDDIDLDVEENTEFYFVEPQNIDEYMSNATNNLKNVSNEIKSLTLDEQNEPFQRKMAAKHRKMKKKLIGLGGNRKKVGPYNQNPPYERSKSAPPGFGGALQEMLTEIEFDLSKFAMRDQLCPNFWQNEKLNSEIRKKLLEIAEDFVKDTPIEGRIDDITFTGSLAGYNYSDSSDIDLHILVDFNKDDELIKDLMNALRINWNNNHDIRIVGHEVEIYVQDSNEKHYSSGVYSISDDEWLQKPSKDSPKIDTSAVLKKAEGLSDEIDALQDEFNEQKYEKVHNSVQRLRKKLKNMRSAGLEDEGIYSIENLAFKLLRSSGQISKLMILGNDSYDYMMGYGKKDKKNHIKVKINRNLDEKRKKKRKKRKKRRKTAGYGGYFPYYDLYDSSGGDSGGDGGGGE